MSRLGPPKYKRGQPVVFVDEDEDGLMQPHAGVVFEIDDTTGTRIYVIQESEKQFYMTVEEDLTPIKQGN